MGRDKALATIHGERLIDLVRARLEPQVDKLLISGPEDYGTGLFVVHDLADAPPGPAGGLYSVCMQLMKDDPSAAGFFSAPVDAPFIPCDLISRLGWSEMTTIASDGANDHPTFAYWRCDTLKTAFAACDHGSGVALKKLAQLCRAQRVVLKNDRSLANINTLDDLKGIASETAN